MIRSHRTIPLRANSVAPVVSADKIAAGIPDERHLHRAQGIQHVTSQTVFIRQRIAGIINPAVDRTPQVLEKSTEQAAINRSDHMVLAEMNGRDHGCLLWRSMSSANSE